PEIPLSIGGEIALFSCAQAVDDHRSTWYQRTTGVAHRAGDRSGIGCLAVHRQSAERKYGGPKQGAGRVHRGVPHQLLPPTVPKAGRTFSIVRILGIRPRQWTWPNVVAKPMAICR